MAPKKIVRFEGSSKEDLSAFPKEVKEDAGHALYLVQCDEEPPDWSPLPEIGPGVCEIRVDDGNAYRVIYVAKFEEAIYVLHAFNKKSKKGIAIPNVEKNKAKTRYSKLVERRKNLAKAAKKKP